jgi:hypothetical protein
VQRTCPRRGTPLLTVEHPLTVQTLDKRRVHQSLPLRSAAERIDGCTLKARFNPRAVAITIFAGKPPRALCTTLSGAVRSN